MSVTISYSKMLSAANGMKFWFYSHTGDGRASRQVTGKAQLSHRFPGFLIIALAPCEWMVIISMNTGGSRGGDKEQNESTIRAAILESPLIECLR